MGQPLGKQESNGTSALISVLNYLNFHKVCHSHQGAGLSTCTFLSDQLSSGTSRTERLNVRLSEKSRVTNYLYAVTTTILDFYFRKKIHEEYMEEKKIK